MATQWKLRTIVAAVGMALVAPMVMARTTGVAQATASSSQVAAGSIDYTFGSNNTATASNHVLQNAKGNIGANIAAGNGNMQVNNTDIALANGALTKKTSTSSLVDNAQWSNLFSVSESADVTNTASVSQHALQNAAGNIGLNVASGADNMQANNTAISHALGVLPSGQASAMIESGQLSGPVGIDFASGDNNTASLSNHVLQNASGNIGVNVAAGDGNMQANALAVSYNRGGLDAYAGAESAQGALFVGAMTFGADNDATLSNHVLQNASGNIGVNAAAGTQNMQANNTSVALNWSTRSGGVASAGVANNQNAGPLAGSISEFGDDDAAITNHVLQNASGNVNVNVASGAENMQANGLASAYNNAGKFASAAIDNDQGTESFLGNSGRYSYSLFGADNAYLNDKVLQNASGNVGVNVAAGDWNQQANDLSIAYAAGPVGSTTTATAAISDNQASNMAFYFPSMAFDTLGSMTATLSNHVLQNATGNIGVNVASGLQNAQANNTALAQGWGTGNGDMDADNTGGPATALITGTQSSGWYSIAADTGAANTASVSGHVLQNASGNIGANVTAGVQNMQSNDLAYAFNQAGSNASAVSQVSQVSLGAIATDTPVSFCSYNYLPVVNSASVSNHVLQNASGNIGLNVAAGAANMQRNTLTIADAD